MYQNLIITSTKTTTQDRFSSADGSPCRLVPSLEHTMSSLDPTPNWISHLQTIYILKCEKDWFMNNYPLYS